MESEEVRLDSLKAGDQFAQYNTLYPDRWLFGTVRWVGTGSVCILLDNERDPVHWAREAPVIPLPASAPQISTGGNTVATKPAAKKSAPAPVNAKVVDEKIRQNLTTRLTFQLKQLLDSNPAKNKTALAMIPRILSEAKAAEFQLPSPSSLGFEGVDDHDVFGGYTFGAGVKPEPTVQSKAKEAQAAKAATQKPARAVKPKKEPSECLDGCGVIVNARFAPGHDAKLKSLITKVERGQVPVESIEGPAAELVKFKLGAKEKDDAGNSIQLRICTQAPVRIPGRDDVAYV